MVTTLVPSSFESISHDDTHERLESSRTGLLSQLEGIPQSNASLQSIVELLSVLFRFLHRNLRVKQQLVHDYNELSKRIQTAVSSCAQYIHDRHKHENELVLLKDQICQTLGRIGYTQQSLEHYRTIIHSLEHESERLEILLCNPHLAQMNQQKFQAFEQNQRIQLDRLMKDNERLRLSIENEKESIISLQAQIERDIEELQALKSLFVNVQHEERKATDQRGRTGLSSNRTDHH